MPCTCDGWEPSARQAESKRVAGHIVHLDRRLGRETAPGVARAAEDTYGDVTLADGMAADLCATLRGLTPEQLDAIVYDGRNPDARALADWWDRHQAADAERARREAEEERQRALAESARAKLTPEELRAITGK